MRVGREVLTPRQHELFESQLVGQRHPDYTAVTNFPGWPISLAPARLDELGDDRQRFADARALKAYAGSAPVIRAQQDGFAAQARALKPACKLGFRQ